MMRWSGRQHRVPTVSILVSLFFIVFARAVPARAGQRPAPVGGSGSSWPG